MTQQASIKQLFRDPSYKGKQMTLEGWVRTRRDSKAGISFIALSDGSCFDAMQCVVPNTLANYESEVLNVNTGCAVRITGELVESQGKGQSVELQATEVEVVGWVEDPATYPMAAKRHTMEHLREYSHLRVRTNVIGAVSRVRHGIARAVHNFFAEQEFFWINTPILSACDCEGAGDLFTVTQLDLLNVPKDHAGAVDYSKDFFGQHAFLTVSGQLNVEAYCMALSKVYTFGPTFRAENSNTARHLAEFWMIEPEIAFADLDDDIDLAEALLKYVCKDILENYPDDMAFFAKWVDKECINRMQKMLQDNFVRIDYTEAVEKLLASNKKFEYPVKWGIDLQTEHERYLTEELYKAPVVVKNYPKDIKAFYMRMNDDQKTVAAMDVLLPGVGEIIGGSQREERFDLLRERLMDSGLSEHEYSWYLDLRRYGTVQHAGFGLGFERLIRYITGIANVRDVIPYPRVPGVIPPNGVVAGVVENCEMNTN
ncbi:MAG: asparagine--tRNA ligase [Coxiellaceae bacterium]|nr:asparagine--tRNA ligase [Coxiellaceae bacterium]